MKLILPLIIHVAPVAIYLAGYQMLAVAGLLFTATCYIKVFKMQEKIDDLTDEAEKQSYLKTKSFWKNLTFLK